jgi:hypothetical protein
MLDHVFTDAIGALRDALERALLERLAFEERLQADVLLGDLTWETAYGLPGEGTPPRVRADITMLWPTWSQAAYRSWYIDEELSELPRIDIAVNLRVQGLAEAPQPEQVLGVLPPESPEIEGETLSRSGATVETFHPHGEEPVHSIEVTYEGTYELGEPALADGSILDQHFSDMGGWISSTLVKLGDLEMKFPPSG